MFADPRKVRSRRLKRRLKAAASVLVALVAGAFLACKGEGPPEARSPAGPDARGAPGDAGEPEASSAPPAEAGAPASDATADAGDASAPRDASADAKTPRVDRSEHRKGMPVRDNLLE